MTDPQNTSDQTAMGKENADVTDRTISPVAKPGSRNLGTVMIFGGAALAVAWVVMSDNGDHGEAEAMTSPQALEFSTGVKPATGDPAAPAQEDPAIAELETRLAEAETPKPVAASPPPAPVYAYRSPADMEAEREAKAREAARRKSQLVIFDQSRTTPQPDNAPRAATTNDTGSLTRDAQARIAALTASLPEPGELAADRTGFAPRRGRNPNEEFLAQVRGQTVETTKAKVLPSRSHVILQGTLIPGVLETAIQSDLPGLLRAVVSEDVYAFDGSRVLIPKASRLVGQYRSGLVTGETRAFIVWTRLIRPDGVSIELDSQGTDALGRAGVGGYVDTHFLQRFGAATLLSLVGAGVEAAIGGKGGTISVETGRSFNEAAEIALQNQINIPPTIHVPQGTRIKVFVAKDLDFSGVGE